MLEIEIDGQTLSVNDGATVMDAAAQAGVYIPHFCYHKKLSIAANCRMCLVQVEKAPKPLPACATPVTNGMKVWTHSESAVKAQNGVMEFLLINHPLDCPICDQGGECQLQDLAVGYGASQSRYQEEKRVVFNKNLGPLVATDMTRCINCTRCVRFTQEIAGDMELGQAFRGEHAEIMPFIERTVDSELSGNIIDLCPVGALTSKPFRFSARTWELARRRSISPHDALGSNLIVQVKHDTVKRVLPLENEDINECWLSDKDRFSYEALNSEERLVRPMVREGDTWKETDWQTALELAVEGIKNAIGEEASALGALASPHSTLEELYLLQKLVRGIGSDNVDFRLRQTDFRADANREGAPWLGMQIAEVSDLDRLLVVGSFLRKDSPLLAQRVRQACKKGLKVSVLHPTQDDWALPIAAHLAVAPSAMVEVLSAVARTLASKKNASLDGRLPQTGGTDIDDALVEQVATSLADGERVAVWLGNLAMQHPRAAELQVVASVIADLTGGRFGVIGEAANSVGGYLAGAVPDKDGSDAQRMIDSPCRAYILMGAEPAHDFANGSAAVRALSAGFVVALSSFRSVDLEHCADVLLPITPFTETSGTFVNTEGRAQSFLAVAPPQGNARPGWKVLRVLGNLFDLESFEFDDSESVRAAVLPEGSTPQLSNAIGAVAVRAEDSRHDGLERIADVPIYFADPLVRRASSLQRTRDAQEPTARASSATLAKFGVNAGERITFASEEGKAELVVVADEGVAPGCVRIAAAHPTTYYLGQLNGKISVERV